MEERKGKERKGKERKGKESGYSGEVPKGGILKFRLEAVQLAAALTMSRQTVIDEARRHRRCVIEEHRTGEGEEKHRLLLSSPSGERPRRRTCPACL